MSALMNLVAAICRNPDVERAALLHDTNNPEYQRLFVAACDEVSRSPDDDFPDVTDDREPDLPASDLGDPTPAPTEF